MPTSLPPLPSEIGKEPPADSSSGKRSPRKRSAFAGASDPVASAVQQIETGYQQLALLSAPLVPFCAQAISTLRMTLDTALGAGASAGPGGAAPGPPGAAPPGMPPGAGGPGSPAITGMGQNPTMLPPPPGQ